MISSNLIPLVEPVDFSSFSINKSRLLITSEGFEERSLSFLSQELPKCFDKIIISKYYPLKKSRYNELLSVIYKHYSNDVVHEITFNRIEPFLFEIEMQEHLAECSSQFDEIVLDISVMSKYMIMQIMSLLKDYSGELRVIYTEPMQYAPLKESELLEEQTSATVLPSVGVQNIIRTPLLTSLIMQQSPSMLVTFLSFNEQLIRALLSECNPARLMLINGVPPHLAWREAAMNDIHKNIIKEYYRDNQTDKDGLLVRKCSTLNYTETFELIADIYKKFGEDYRIILSPTGSKMQAIGCALIKNCCEDIHIEYPTPESYYVDGFSSSEIREIHQVYFSNFQSHIQLLSGEYCLNG